jgi:hypothetical protein
MTSTPKSDQPDSSQPNRRKKRVQLITVLLLAVALFLVLLPIGMRFYLQRWLVNNGADTAVIRKISFNPFAGKISLQGTNIKIADTTVISDADIMINLGMLSLLKKEAVIQQAVLDGVTFDAEVYEDGRIRLGSYTITPPGEELPEPESADTQLSWVIRAQDVQLRNCTIRFKMPDLELIANVDEASMLKFDTVADDHSGTFKLTGSVNGTPVMIDLDLLKILPNILARGRIKIDGFSLNNLADLLKPYLDPFTGQAWVDGMVDFSMPLDSLDISTDYKGSIALEKSHIAGESFSVQGAPVRWEKGSVHFEMTEEKGIIIRTDGLLTGKELGVDIFDPVINIREPDLAIEGKVLVTIDDEVTVDTDAGFTLAKTTLNMPPLAAEVSNVHWQGKDRRVRFNSGTGNKNLSVQTSGELLVEKPMFADKDSRVQLDVHGDSVSWNGDVSYQLALKAGEPSLVTTRGKLQGRDLALKLGSLLQYSQGKISADGSSKVSLAAAVKVEYDGGLNLSETEYAMSAIRSRGGEISWQGHGAFTLGSGNNMQLALNGGLTGKKVDLLLIESGLGIFQNELKFKTGSIMEIAPDISLKGKTSLETTGLSITQGDKKLAGLKRFYIDAIDAPGGRKITVKKAEADGLEVDINGNMPLKTAVKSVELSNIGTDDLEVFHVEQLSLQNPLVTSVKNGKKLAGLNTLIIKKIKAGLDQKITVNRINLDDLFFLGDSGQDKNAVCRLASTRVSRLDWGPETGTHAGSVSLADLNCRLVKEKDGTFAFVRQLKAMQTEPGEKNEMKKDKPKNSGAAFRLDKLTLRGDGTIHYRDFTLPRTFKSKMIIKTLQVNNLDSGRPAKPAKIKLIALMAGRAPMEVHGTVAPFSDPPSLDLQLNLKNYPLVKLSPYSIQAVGVGLASGQLRINSNIKLKDNTLDMQNSLVLQQLETKTIARDLAEKLDNQLPVPLDSALALLRNSEGNIKLDVPLHGKLDKLNVGVSDVLITALSKAIVPAASGYLMYTLGPYGALAWVGMEVGKKLLQINLPPVEFSPGSAELPENADDYFKRLVKILQDKPKADFQLCPRSAAWEFMSESEKKEMSEDSRELSEEEREKLTKLGQQRARVVKDHLIDTYSVDKDRLLICISLIEMEKNAKPRVDIQMSRQ